MCQFGATLGNIRLDMLKRLGHVGGAMNKTPFQENQTLPGALEGLATNAQPALTGDRQGKDSIKANNMGEYIEIDGKAFKLGTCENLYYVTFQRLVEMVGNAKKLEGNARPCEYLTTGWRYRFPFPDENGDASTSSNYERSINVTVYDDALVKLVGEFEHFTMQTTVSPATGKDSKSYLMAATLNVPCPQSDKWQGVPHAKNVVGICQQKSTVEAGGPQLWTVVCCPFCGAKTRLEWEGAEKLANEIIRRAEKADADFWKAIAAEIVAGYFPENAFELHGFYDRETLNVAQKIDDAISKQA